MLKRLLALFIAGLMILSLASCASKKSVPSSPNTQLTLKSTATELWNKATDLAMKTKFRLIYGSNDFYNNQWQTVKTLTKLESNVYMLDYKYDYDIDDLLDSGADSIVSLLAYCGKHLLYGKSSCTLNIDELGCSGFACQNSDGDRLMGRNFDYKDAPCMVVWTNPEDGYASVSMVDTNMMLIGDINKPDNDIQLLLAPYIPLDGINEKGLSIGVLQVKADGTAQDTGKTDIVTTVAIRAILDKAANVNEAIDLLSKFDMHDMLSSCSYHYILSDAEGNSCVIEYINNEMRVLWGNQTETSATVQAVTNFFLSEDGNADEPEGQVRYQRIVDALKVNDGTLDEIDALKLLNSVHLNYQHKKYPWKVTTLWSAVYNANDITLTMCARMNYATIYSFSPNAPLTANVIPGSAEIDNYEQAPN